MDDIICPLTRAVQQWGDHTAIQTSEQSFTYVELDLLVCRAVAVMQQRGIQAGERIAIVAPNCWQYVVVVLALLRMQAVACPLSTRFTPKQILDLLDTIDCKRIIVAEDLLSRYTFPGIDSIALSSVCSEQENTHIEHKDYTVSLNQDATILCTSGTTALPKAVLHTYGNHYYSALGSNENMPMCPGDNWLIALPLYHIGGLAIMFRVLLSGASMTIERASRDVMEFFHRYRITHASLVPLQLYHFLHDSTTAQHHLKALLVGGAATPEPLIKQAKKKNLPIFTTYGMTETASQVTTTVPHDTLPHLCTSGKVLPYREISITDDGEILVKGETLFKGYIHNKQITPAVDTDGWFHTGDIGSLTDDNYLLVRGRKDNMFISGGENIHPEVIETVLMESEQVEIAVVVPVPDTVFGHRPVAFVKMKDNSNLNIEELKQFVKQLPTFMMPIAWYPFPDEFQHTTAKPDRGLLSDMAVKHLHTQDML